jgi:glycine/serine hydroxymethyltransferase
MPTASDRAGGIRDVSKMSGLRLGTFAITCRGFTESATVKLTHVMADALKEYAALRKEHGLTDESLRAPLETLIRRYHNLISTIQVNRLHAR